MYIVYVKVDEMGRITAVNSDEFITDLTGWAKVDEGEGDRYHHAQGNYLDGTLMDERGVYRYKLAGGEVVERTAAEMNADYVPPAHAISDTDAALIELAGMIAELYMAQAELATLLAGGDM